MGAGSAPCQLTQRQGAQIPMQTPKRSFKTVAKPYAVRCAYWSKVRYLLFKGKRVGKTTNCVKYGFGAKNGEMLDYNQVKARRAKQLRCPQSGPPVTPRPAEQCSCFRPVLPLVWSPWYHWTNGTKSRTDYAPRSSPFLFSYDEGSAMGGSNHS